MTLSNLEILKQRFIEQRKPFPLSALLRMYESSNRKDTYINGMEGFRLLAEWLHPIEITQAPPSTRIPKLHQSYEIQEIARILNTSQENIYHATLQYKQSII